MIKCRSTDILDTLTIPKRQGELYAFDLGRSYGPFLPSDIDLYNQKSISLLAGLNIIQSSIIAVKACESYKRQLVFGKDIVKRKKTLQLDQSTQVIQERQQNAEQKLGQASRAIKMIQQEVKALNAERRRIKGQFEIIQKSVNQTNEELVVEFRQSFRMLHMQLREIFNQQRNTNYIAQRQLQQIRHQNNRLLFTTLQTQRAVIRQEMQIGICVPKDSETEIQNQLNL